MLPSPRHRKHRLVTLSGRATAPGNRRQVIEIAGAPRCRAARAAASDRANRPPLPVACLRAARSGRPTGASSGRPFRSAVGLPIRARHRTAHSPAPSDRAIGASHRTAPTVDRERATREVIPPKLAGWARGSAPSQLRRGAEPPGYRSGAPPAAASDRASACAARPRHRGVLPDCASRRSGAPPSTSRGPSHSPCHRVHRPAALWTAPCGKRSRTRTRLSHHGGNGAS
ncbi:hypothetical protein APR09_002273 [Nocardia amikacinitolerans]|nr:hypothetical protein [Nocardia amikacinitolerans]